MKKIVEKIKKDHRIAYILLSLFALAALYICFYKLGNAYFDDWDEAWYAEMTKQMLHSGKLIVLEWNHEFLFDKPPLYIWLSAIVSSVIGLSEFSVRFTSAITGFLTICLTIWYTYKKWGILPAFLAFVTLALNNIFIWRVRSGNLDSLATFLIFLTFLATISKHKYRYIFLGLLFSAIYLTKISLVFFPLAIFGFHEVVYGWRTIHKNILNYLLMGSIGLVLVGGWLYMGGKIAGPEFTDYYLHRADQGVANLTRENFKTDYWQFAYYSLQRRFFYVLIAGWLLLLTDFKKKENVLMLFYSLFLLVSLSFTERTNNWYLTPAIPFWSLIIGYATYRLINVIPRLKPVVIIIIILPTLYVSQKTFKENITPLINTSSSASHTASAKRARELTKEGDVIARLDHLYPATIYYSDRKVFASPDGVGTSNLFISRPDLVTGLTDGSIALAVGKNGDIESFIKANKLVGKTIIVNEEEKIFIPTPPPVDEGI